MKPLVIRSAIVASLGGLIFGFDTAVISGTTESLKEVFHLDDAGLGWTVGIALLGTILGALIAISREAGDRQSVLGYARRAAALLPDNPELQRLLAEPAGR